MCNWEQRESEYYRHFDPYDDGMACEDCEAPELDMCICEDEEAEE